MILRIIFFIILLCIAAFLPTWVYIVGAILYALRFTAYELVFLAVLIDAFYGQTGLTLIPFYTIGTAVCLIIIEWVKPQISVYN